MKLFLKFLKIRKDFLLQNLLIPSFTYLYICHFQTSIDKIDHADKYCQQNQLVSPIQAGDWSIA